MALRSVAPNQALKRELGHVSRDAIGVLANLDSLNSVPVDFPLAEVRELCLSLRDLKDGTDEGCRTQLESARNRLPKWRRQHFLDENDVASHEDEPRFIRGMYLDQQLGQLFISTSTALDEYRAQVQEHFDDSIRPEDTLRPGDGSGVADAIQATLDVEDQVSAAKGELLERLDAAEASVDLLTRRLTDSVNLARVARSELRARPIVRRWYNAVVAA